MPLMLGYWCHRTLATAATVCLLPASDLQQQRTKFSEMNCKPLMPKCGDRFKQKPCDSKEQKIILKQPAPEPLPLQKRSIKLKRPAACCGDICENSFPRFDSLYYKRSDKFSREYQQTWAECPELIKKPKLICCPEKIKLPKWKKRARSQRPQTACKQVCASINTKCPNIRMPGCRQAQKPPKCRPSKAKAFCMKSKAPFPSFSECSRKPPRPKYPIECRCLLVPTLCEAWQYYYKMKRVKKVNLS